MTGASTQDDQPTGRGSIEPDDRPREVDGKCSRCGKPWPCLDCLTSTPPFVPIFNNF